MAFNNDVSILLKLQNKSEVLAHMKAIDALGKKLEKGYDVKIRSSSDAAKLERETIASQNRINKSRTTSYKSQLDDEAILARNRARDHIAIQQAIEREDKLRTAALSKEFDAHLKNAQLTQRTARAEEQRLSKAFANSERIATQFAKIKAAQNLTDQLAPDAKRVINSGLSFGQSNSDQLGSLLNRRAVVQSSLSSSLANDTLNPAKIAIAEAQIQSLNRRIIETGLSTDNLRNSFSRAKDSLGDLVNTGANLSSAFYKVAGSVGVLTAAGGALAVAFGVKVATSLNEQRRVLDGLTGDAVKGEATFARLKKFADATAAEPEPVIRSTRTLLSYGTSVEQAADLTERLAKVAAVSGSDLNLLATAVGQVTAKGKLQGQEFKQLTDNGLSFRKELAAVAKVQESELDNAMRNGKLTLEVFNEALNQATSDTSRVGRSFTQLNGTIAVQGSTFKARIKDIFGTLAGLDLSAGNAGNIKAGSITDFIIKSLQQFNEGKTVAAAQNLASKINDIFTSKLSKISIGGLDAKLGGFIDNFSKNLPSIITKIKEFGAGITPAIKGLIDGFRIAGAVTKQFVSIIGGGDIATGITRITSALLILRPATLALSALSTGINGVKIAFTGLSVIYDSVKLLTAFIQISRSVGTVNALSSVIASLGVNFAAMGTTLAVIATPALIFASFQLKNMYNDLKAQQLAANTVEGSYYGLSDGLDVLAAGAGTAVGALKNLRQEISGEAAIGAIDGYKRALESVRLAQEDYNTAVSEYGVNSQQATDANLRLKDSQYELVKSQTDVTSAVNDFNTKVNELKGKLGDAGLAGESLAYRNSLLAQLDAAIAAAGGNQELIDKYIGIKNRLLEIPESKSVKFLTNAEAVLQNEINSLANGINSLPNTKTIGVTLDLSAARAGLSSFQGDIGGLGGIQVTRAAGGPVYKALGGAIYAAKGMFTPRGTDTVPAMLTPGEYVINKRAVDKLGRGFMDGINQGNVGKAVGNLTGTSVGAVQAPNITNNVYNNQKSVNINGVSFNSHGSNDRSQLFNFRNAVAGVI